MLETKGGFYITQIKQLHDRIFERLLLENGMEISGGQGRILFILWQRDYLTISEISEKTSLAKNTVSIVIDGMVNKGFVERKINPQNRRQSIVSLTEYAKSLQAKYEEVSRQMNLFPRATSQVAACRHLATAARVKDPAALQRCKFDTPLLAAGSLIILRRFFGTGAETTGTVSCTDTENFDRKPTYQ